MKRSSHVALLLMGMTTAGASAYALMPSRDCAAPQAPAPEAIAPQTLAPGTAGSAKPVAPCTSGARSSGGSRTYWYSRSYSHGSSSTQQPPGRHGAFSPSQSHTSVPSVGHGPSTHGGFGSTGHSMAAAHSSGG